MVVVRFGVTSEDMRKALSNWELLFLFSKSMSLHLLMQE